MYFKMEGMFSSAESADKMCKMRAYEYPLDLVTCRLLMTTAILEGRSDYNELGIEYKGGKWRKQM